MSAAAVALAVAAGLAGSVQVAVMGRFGGRVGVFEALAFSTAVQLFFSVCVLLAARGGIGGLHHVFSPARAAGIVLLGIGAGLSLVR